MSEFYWQKANTSNASLFLDKAVLAGRDMDGSDIYAGRAKYKGDLMPAKIIPGTKKACVSYAGREKDVTNFEMYLKRPGGTNPKVEIWVACCNGEVASGAAKFGETSNGEELYMGRAHHLGMMTPGKVHQSHRCLYIPFGGVEHSYKDYEVLVLQPSAYTPGNNVYSASNHSPVITTQYIPPVDGAPAFRRRVFAQESPIVTTQYIPPQANSPAAPLAAAPAANAAQAIPLLQTHYNSAPIHVPVPPASTFQPATVEAGHAEKVNPAERHYGWNLGDMIPHVPFEVNAFNMNRHQPQHAAPGTALPPYMWQRVTNKTASSFVSRAVKSGYDKGEIFVGRAHLGEDLLPAKVIPATNKAYVSNAGQEVEVEDFEMYLRQGSAISMKEKWVPDKNGKVPAGALKVGKTGRGEPLYVGRTQHRGTQTPGKVQGSYGCLLIPYDCQELTFEEYEVLVIE